MCDPEHFSVGESYERPWHRSHPDLERDGMADTRDELDGLVDDERPSRIDLERERDRR